MLIEDFDHALAPLTLDIAETAGSVRESLAGAFDPERVPNRIDVATYQSHQLPRV